MKNFEGVFYWLALSHAFIFRPITVFREMDTMKDVKGITFPETQILGRAYYIKAGSMRGVAGQRQWPFQQLTLPVTVGH